ncbi:hypothetical protein F5Y16DRAFT_398479 [Xylariaceae sp. FL0255]|nr:hypothetical protein F5Y16DRAFT_398479 [Xylariaceae sp. FL0255]
MDVEMDTSGFAAIKKKFSSDSPPLFDVNMDASRPATPKKVSFSDTVQEMTPPPTVLKDTKLSDAQNDGLASTTSKKTPVIRLLLTPKKEQNEEAKAKDQQQPSLPEKVILAKEKEGGREKTEIHKWLDTSTSREQRRERFYTLLHATYPNDEEFNCARNPFYDSDNDEGLTHEEWVMFNFWEGPWPFHDDDYDPITNPFFSREVWEPKIGDAGIENETDVRMVLKMREEHEARGAAIKKRKDKVIKAQKKAGVKHSDVDLTRVYFGPDKVDPSEFESYYETETDHDAIATETLEHEGPAVKEETSLDMAQPKPQFSISYRNTENHKTEEDAGKEMSLDLEQSMPQVGISYRNTNPPMASKPQFDISYRDTIPSEASKPQFGIWYDDTTPSEASKPKKKRGRPKANKKSKTNNKRKRNGSDDDYKPSANSDSDDVPIIKKTKKTKQGTRRPSGFGFDGAYDADDEMAGNSEVDYWSGFSTNESVGSSTDCSSEWEGCSDVEKVTVACDDEAYWSGFSTS